MPVDLLEHDFVDTATHNSQSLLNARRGSGVLFLCTNLLPCLALECLERIHLSRTGLFALSLRPVHRSGFSNSILSRLPNTHESHLSRESFSSFLRQQIFRNMLHM